MPRWFGVPSLLPVLLLLPTGVSSQTADAGCTPRPEGPDDLPTFAFVVDGEVRQESALSDPPKDLMRLEIVCWDAAEKWLGISVRNAAVMAHTKGGPAATTMASLHDLVKVQEKYHERNGAYTDDLLSLSAYAPSGGIYVYLTLTENGWTARTEDSSLHQVCQVYVGTRPEVWAPSQAGPEPWFAEGEPVCL